MEEKTIIEVVKEKFPKSLTIIESIPRTTKEDNIKEKWSKIVKNVINIINSHDDKILEEIGAKNTRFLYHFKGEAIQFQCNYGDGEICYESDEEFKEFNKGTSSVYLRNNKEIKLGLSWLFQKEVTEKLREYHETKKNNQGI